MKDGTRDLEPRVRIHAQSMRIEEQLVDRAIMLSTTFLPDQVSGVAVELFRGADYAGTWAFRTY
jgi:hypothetical protein